MSEVEQIIWSTRSFLFLDDQTHLEKWFVLVNFQSYFNDYITTQKSGEEYFVTKEKQNMHFHGLSY